MMETPAHPDQYVNLRLTQGEPHVIGGLHPVPQGNLAAEPPIHHGGTVPQTATP